MQPKLTVGAPDDAYEREADQVADQVMASATPSEPATEPSPTRVQRRCAECEAEASEEAESLEDEGRVQTKATDPSHRPSATAYSNLGLDSGRSLPATTRRFFETRMSADFSAVRVHTGGRAASAASALGARAFTVGPDIGFAAGEFAPQSAAGQHLLAHELTHVLQQADAQPRLQRACDPAALAGRSAPVFFPEETVIMEVFNGTRTLSDGDHGLTAVGLIQQALVDLGYDLGPHGPRNDGVDRKFGSDTAQGVRDFQNHEGIIAAATAGVMDESTVRCLDEIRSQREVPAHQHGTVPPEQHRVEGQKTGGRDEDIYFPRGASSLDGGDRAKINRLTNAHKGCTLELEGFMSEDERVDFGASLVDDRLDAVDNEFAANNQGDPGVCPHPSPPLRIKNAHPNASSGVSDYRQRRKVEVVPPGATSQTMPCPPGAAQFRALTAPEDSVLTDAIDDARDWLNTALGKLTPGDPDGDAALNAYFGGTGRRGTIKSNLQTWRDHVDNVVRSNNRHGTQCNATCDSAIAFNNGAGASAQMTVCSRFFGSVTVHGLNQSETKAFIIMHEAGHGAIGTRDTGYGHGRLIEFLSQYPAIAENNTDSYTLMVLCLNGEAALCSPPGAADVTAGLSPAEETQARRGLAWLQTWLMWGSQDTSSLFRRINNARQSGQDVRAINSYYADVFDILINAFDVRRAAGNVPPTFREQTLVASIRDRLRLMQEASGEGLEVEKDTTAPLQERWESGGPHGAPGRKLYLINSYFALGNDRDRVERLLPLIIEAANNIDSSVKPHYEAFIKEDIRAQRGNQP